MKTSKIQQILSRQNNQEIERCPFPTGIIEVNLCQLESNIRKIRKFVGQEKTVKLLFPVKANAYGHGMNALAEFLELQKLCDYFGVAHLEEAYELRQHGIKSPILILGQSFSDPKQLEQIILHDIEQAISDEKLLLAVDAQAKKLKSIAKIHLSIDTGMGRCGVLNQDVPTLAARIKKCKNIKLVGVMTHFSVADNHEPKAKEYTNNQINLFANAKKIILENFSEEIIFHTSNSAGTISHVHGIHDMIRPGIAAYGYPEHDLGLKLKPILSLTTKISLIKQYPINHHIGYGHSYTTQKNNEKIGIIPIGYGDGLNRSLSNKLTPITNSKKTISVGRISMDQMAIKVNENTKINDEVIVIGQIGKIENTAHDLAIQSNTITYEILCNLGNARRLRHNYIYNN